MQGLLERFPDHKTTFLNVAQGILVNKPTLASAVVETVVQH